MFPLFPETRKTFQKCNPPHFKFYLSNLTNKKISPYGVMYKFSLLFCIVYWGENILKNSITPYGDLFLWFNFLR